MRQWNTGNPPEIGWWPASTCCEPKTIRWWNGECWSVPCFTTDSAEFAAKEAMKPEKMTRAIIRWTDRWWL